MIITCKCGKSYDVAVTNDVPKNATSLSCNWCPECQNEAEDYYKEWYNYKKVEKKETVDPNQLKLL